MGSRKYWWEREWALRSKDIEGIKYPKHDKYKKFIPVKTAHCQRQREVLISQQRERQITYKRITVW